LRVAPLKRIDESARTKPGRAGVLYVGQEMRAREDYVTITAAPTQTHDEDFEQLLWFDDVGSDCHLCQTGMTRACECGGRVHNEMHDGVVQMCFSCGVDWTLVDATEGLTRVPE